MTAIQSGADYILVTSYILQMVEQPVCPLAVFKSSNKWRRWEKLTLLFLILIWVANSALSRKKFFSQLYRFMQVLLEKSVELLGRSERVLHKVSVGPTSRL